MRARPVSDLAVTRRGDAIVIEIGDERITLDADADANQARQECLDLAAEAARLTGGEEEVTGE